MKTCVQKVMDLKTGRMVARRLPHDVPVNAGYQDCAACGTTVYTGEERTIYNQICSRCRRPIASDPCCCD
jgi:hypothetical protein